MSTESDSDNERYRDFSQQWIFALIAAIIVMLLLVGIVFYQVLHRPLPPFSAVAPDGRSLPLIPRDEPNFLPKSLLRWAGKAAVAAYTFDFVNHEKEIALARPYFTEAGWKAYQSAINQVIKRVEKGQLFVSGVVSGTPIISNQGELPGHGYTWRVQIPFLVTFQSSEEVQVENYTVIMMIVKIPTSINPVGVGIDQFEMV